MGEMIPAASGEATGAANLAARFEALAARFPDRPAVTAGGEVLSYAELGERARRIAAAVTESAGGGDHRPVALLLDLEPDLVAAVLGVLRAGRPFTVLHALDAPARLAAVFADSLSPVLITGEHHRSAAEAVTGGRGQVIVASRLRGAGASIPAAAPAPDATAYVLYTSGSTGEPKGVMQTHGGVLHDVDSATREFGFNERDRFTVLASPAFGQTATVLFRALLNGACLVLRDLRHSGTAGLAAWLVRERATVYQSVPSVFRALIGSLTAQDRFPELRLVRLAGEPIGASDVAAFRRCFGPRCRLVNGYGSTETKEIARFVIDRSTELPDGIVPVGYPVEGVWVRVCTPEGEEVAPGGTGEVRVRSPRLSPGYWRDARLTAARFPVFDPATGAREFCTGDLGRRLRGGELVLQGRTDSQLKIRGYRLAPAAVEAAMLALPGVEQVAVVGRAAADGGTELAAYLMVTPGVARDAAAVRARLRRHVPPYMVPARLEFLDSMPLLPNGKLDRRSLPAAADAVASAVPNTAAGENATEDAIARIWSEVLQCGPVAVDEDFFDLGGSSLQAGAMLNRIARAFEVDAPPGVLGQARTVRGLAAWIDAGGGGFDAHDAGSTLVALRAQGGGVPVFLVPGGGGDELITFGLYDEFARHMNPARPVYAFVNRGTDGSEAGESGVMEMAGRYARELRAVVPSGPFHLVGHCSGAIIALEMARLFYESREGIGPLILMDARLRGHANRYWRNVKTRLAGPRRFLRVLRGRAAHHAPQLRSLGLRAGLRYVVAKLRMTRDLYSHATNSFVHVYADESAARAAYRARYDYIVKGRSHRPACYSGAVTVLANSQWHEEDPGLGWQSVVRGPLDTRPLPGTHADHIREHTAEVARILDDCLDEAERSWAGSPAAPDPSSPRRDTPIS